ncbi:ankyrin repeat domain-containing protein [Singulisphaera sp. Ch08]|uniref:Ankyrin repeat domain-containing protein n=1 Tax=Singulisphaera sp. Ch08 TaxID=3120278 RepID=A0AAU7CIZ5_9BACT
MDFGGFILFMLLAAGLIIFGLCVAAAFLSRSPQRWQRLRLWLAGVVLLSIFGRYLYQVYWLDERLYSAVLRGDVHQVKVLLASGASPNATWEDGTTALHAAQRGGKKEIVLLLKQAGATK